MSHYRYKTPIKVVIIISVIVVLGLFLIPANEKACSTDTDCILVKRGCCNQYGPGDAVNKNAAARINLIKKIECESSNCPLFNLKIPVPTTTYSAVCRNRECAVEEVLSCSKVCSKSDLKSYTSYLNVSEDGLLQKCYCDEIPLIVKNCDVNLPEERCLSSRTIIVGTVIKSKELKYPFEETEMYVAKSFNTNPGKTFTFRSGKEQLKEGEKIKVFIGDMKYAGIIERLNPEEYQKLINLKYFEYLPVSVLK